MDLISNFVLVFFVSLSLCPCAFGASNCVCAPHKQTQSNKSNNEMINTKKCAKQNLKIKKKIASSGNHLHLGKSQAHLRATNQPKTKQTNSFKMDTLFVFSFHNHIFVLFHSKRCCFSILVFVLSFLFVIIFSAIISTFFSYHVVSARIVSVDSLN